MIIEDKIKHENLVEELEEVFKELKKNDFVDNFKRVMNDREKLSCYETKMQEWDATKKINEFLGTYSSKKTKNN